jgi:ribosome biogenesis GTPase
MNFTDCKKGRVVAAFRELYLVELESTNELIKAKLAGKFFYENLSHPTVGDLVDIKNNGHIDHVLPRKSKLSRKTNTEKGGEQLMAANVDYVFITTSLNSDLNFKRIDRYLMMVKDSGAIPVLLFTKLDLLENLVERDEIIESIKVRFANVDQLFCSKDNCEDENFINKFFEKYLTKNAVWVLVGSSGVGKSTFINCFIESFTITTRDIRSSDDKGKHTTTHRQMYKSKYGPWIIDSPGIRELDIDPGSDVIEIFQDIEEMVLSCKFSDCTHESEPLCAIRDALDNGHLDLERFESYKKLYLKKSFDLRTLNSAEKVRVRDGWKKESVKRRKAEALKRKVFY